MKMFLNSIMGRIIVMLTLMNMEPIIKPKLKKSIIRTIKVQNWELASDKMILFLKECLQKKKALSAIDKVKHFRDNSRKESLNLFKE
jgi:hypothetical protein